MKALLIIVLLAGVSAAATAQDKKDAAGVQQIVESKNYIFKAQTASSQRGRTRQLTPGYDFTVKTDSVIAYLPFYGRAYTAPVNSTDGGIKFTSTDFSYFIKKGKKNSWEISIRPKDATDVQEVFLSIYSSGTASLRVTNTSRDGMSYNGYIEAGLSTGKKAF